METHEFDMLAKKLVRRLQRTSILELNIWYKIQCHEHLKNWHLGWSLCHFAVVLSCLDSIVMLFKIPETFRSKNLCFWNNLQKMANVGGPKRADFVWMTYKEDMISKKWLKRFWWFFSVKVLLFMVFKVCSKKSLFFLLNSYTEISSGPVESSEGSK